MADSYVPRTPVIQAIRVEKPWKRVTEFAPELRANRDRGGVVSFDDRSGKDYFYRYIVVYPGHWLIRTQEGKLVSMTDEQFNQNFVKQEESK